MTAADDQRSAGTAQRRRSRWRAEFDRYGLPLGLAAAGIVIWEVGVRLGNVPAYLLPPPSAIVASLLADWKVIYLNIYPTLIAILGGFALSVVIGIPLATLIVFSPLAERVLYPPMIASQAIPKVAIAPLFVVWMGFGVMPKVSIAFLIAFFPVVIDTVIGLRSVQPEMLQLGRSMGGGTLRVFLKLRLPNALPNIFAGLKVAITLAVVGAITGEFVGSQSGLGYLLTSASGQMDTALVFAVLVTISVIATLLFMIIEAVEKLVIPWHSSMRSRNVGR
jgi:NitT/TauT family transport system permease protein